MTKSKTKTEVEKPVFCVVEQTKRSTIDRYRVVIYKNMDGPKFKTITIEDKLGKVEYTLVESEQPSINGHYFRQYCATHNATHHAQQKGIQAQREEERQRQNQADRVKRAEEYQQARQARHQERKQGAKHAGIILKQMAIRGRMMEEVETGQRCL